MKKEIRMGVVGGGRATLELTLPVLKNVPLVKVSGVCDIDEAVSRTLGEKFETNHYTSMEDMIQKEKLDAVIINTPVNTHALLAIRAMELGAHVFIEKPAVAKSAELDAIYDVSKKTGKKFTIAHNYKFLSGSLMAKRLIEEGKIGKVLHVERVWMSPPDKDRMEMDKEGWWHRMPGGRLSDALPHMLYIPFMYVGPMKVLAVSARKISNERPWSVCDESDILLATENAYVNIRQSLNQTSWPYKGYTYHTLIYGTKRNMIVDAFGATIIEGQSLTQKIKEFLRRFRQPSEEISLRGAHNIIYKKFIEYIEGKGPNPTPEEEVRNVVELTEQIAHKMQESLFKSSIVTN